MDGGCGYPWYGMAPHDHVGVDADRPLTFIGRPRDVWPHNFVEDGVRDIHPLPRMQEANERATSHHRDGEAVMRWFTAVVMRWFTAVVMRWFTIGWWKYLLEAPVSWTAFWCRVHGHPGGPVWYNGMGTEPDMTCRDCGDNLG